MYNRSVKLQHIGYVAPIFLWGWLRIRWLRMYDHKWYLGIASHSNTKWVVLVHFFSFQHCHRLFVFCGQGSSLLWTPVLRHI